MDSKSFMREDFAKPPMRPEIQFRDKFTEGTKSGEMMVVTPPIPSFVDSSHLMAHQNMLRNMGMASGTAFVPPGLQAPMSAATITDKIRTILSFTKRGKFCLTFEGKQLPLRFQNVVAELLLDHLLAENDGDRISHALIGSFAAGLVEIFPFEKVETYYIPYSNDKASGIKAPARGKLIQYYHNIPRDLKKAGSKFQAPPP